MGHQRWLAAALALGWMLQPVQARTSAQAAQATQSTQATQADARAATRRQTEQTDQANRDAAVPDEASSAATGARPARAGTDTRVAGNGVSTSGTEAAPTYGPVLYVNGKPVEDTGRRNPSEVHDEADTGINPAAQPAEPQASQTLKGRQKRQAARRHPAWQPETEAMAPRPLHGERRTASNGVPIPSPSAAPEPVVPSSNVINSCQGSFCTDAAGKTYNIGRGNAGVNSNGRLCNRTGATVQCF